MEPAEEPLERLVALGVDRPRAEEALALVGEDFERAANMLMECEPVFTASAGTPMCLLQNIFIMVPREDIEAALEQAG
jgi:hypothetical protein